MDGIILVDKPKGWTSHDVVFKLRKQLKTKKIGHTGTLDPMATGLLVVCVGNATKLVKYLTDHDKEYIAEVTLGIKTNTDDITGTITESVDVNQIDQTNIINALQSFVGTIMQTPPVASAIKVNGKRAYEYIHNNQEEPIMAKREVTISSIELLDKPIIVEKKCLFTIRVSCSKGTYIRSLARDIGIALNLPATLSNLRRTKVGNFQEKDAFCLEDITEDSVHFIDPIHHLGFQTIHIDDEYLFKVSNGAFLPLALFPTTNETIVYNQQEIALAIYTYDQTKNIMRLSVLL